MSCKPNTEQRLHWNRVAELGCILTRRPAEIAHCHGGSMKLLGPEWQPGMAQKQNHWLVIPLSPELHRYGKLSLDEGSVEDWEERWSTQIDLLAQVGGVLGYCVFERAGVDPALVK